MEESLPMHVSQCLQGLIRNIPHFLMWQSSLLLLKLVDIPIEILKNKVELIVLLDKFEQLYDVGVMQFGEDADLVEIDAFVPVLIVSLHSLYGHYLACLLVQTLVYAAETAVTQLVSHLVFLHLNQISIIISDTLISHHHHYLIGSANSLWVILWFWIIIFDQNSSCMDPTKPILDLYSDSSNYNNQRSSAYRSVKSPTLPTKYNRPPPPKEISYTELKEKYQELYQAYSEKVEKVNQYQEQLEMINSENERLREEARRLNDRNEQLNATLLNKNVELEEAYRQLQEDIRRGNKGKKNDEALERLEQGMREAITSNFNLLREAALSELKQF